MNKSNDIKIMLKEAFVLFAITLVAGLMLGFVYQLTKDPIAYQNELAIKKACQSVFPGAERFEEKTYSLSYELTELTSSTGVSLGTVYEAFDSANESLGFVVESTSKEGYGGDIVLYVGVLKDGTIGGVSILSISETAGLGMEAPNVLVPQFAGKKVESFTYTKTGSLNDSEVDAISGATITTKAVTSAVNAGLKLAGELNEGGAN